MRSQPQATEVDIETRRATRWIAACSAAAVLGYLLLAALVTADAPLTRYGRHEGVHFALVRAQQLDRQAVYGDRPVLWVIGSSITREATDELQLRRWMRRDGYDWGVEKYAFGYGAPVFTWAMLDVIDLRPGDLVYTTVSYDNFEVGWAKSEKASPMYLQLLLRPRHLWKLNQFHVADRIEYSLASTPPRSFLANRESFRDGLQQWIEYVVGWSSRRPRMRSRAKEDPFQDDLRTKGLRARGRLPLNRQVKVEDLAFDDSQINWQALGFFVDEVEAAGATPLLGFVEASPHYHRRYLGKGTAEATHAALSAAVPHFRLLEQRPDWEYFDYKHPNYLGRLHTTREVYDWFETLQRDGEG